MEITRYKVPVNIYVDAINDEAAEDFVSDMLCGRETMSRMWDVGTAEKQFVHGQKKGARK